MNNHYSDIGDIRKGDQRVKGCDASGFSISKSRGVLSPGELAESELWGHKIGLAMQHDNESAAIELVKRGLAAMHHREPEGILATPLQSLGIDDLVLNMLDRKLDVLTVGDLLRIDYATLDAVPNLGPLRRGDIFMKLSEHLLRRVLEYERETQ